MTRLDLGKSRLRLLEALEEAHRSARGRKYGPWVGQDELEAAVGRRYVARLFELKKIGFRTGKTQIPVKSRRYFWKLIGYVEDWKDSRVFQTSQMNLFAA